MIIRANTPEGRDAKIFNADGTECTLPIKSYDTITKVVEHYELDDSGKIKFHEWIANGNMMTRQAIVKNIYLEGSYAEINGKRV